MTYLTRPSSIGGPHPDEPALVAYDATDPAAARAATAEICRIRHPDEPGAGAEEKPMLLGWTFD